ncbi:MAG: hypothetical protein EXS31_13825 [Pedosphaera sp.]|nr:hypothetical protein [Pedosphaera sp.]
MKMKQHMLIVAALVGAVQIATAGDITGKITFKGAPAPEQELPLDPGCGKLHSTKPKTRFYVLGAGGELADVFVYIKDGLTGKTFEVPAAGAELDQRGCEYLPYVSGLQVKQKLSVKNSDPVLHNLHVSPGAGSGNKESNKAQMTGSKAMDYTFDSPEVFLKFKCDVHPWMFAYVGVLEHPFYAVTGKDGTFAIKNVPAGKYTVEAVHRKTHPSGKGESKEATVGAAGAKVDFVIEKK